MDRSVSVIVLTGAGGTFCAGMDLKGFLTGDNPLDGGSRVRRHHPAGRRPKPIVAAVEGYALAGGCEIALSCDLIVASSEAKFGLPEVKRGLVAGAGGLLRLPYRIPYHAAMEIALTGDHFPASRLAELGLVNLRHRAGRGTRRGEGAGRQDRGERSRWRSPPPSASWSSPATGRTTSSSTGQGEIINPVFVSKDAMEGAAAFAEKRPPVWTGE